MSRRTVDSSEKLVRLAAVLHLPLLGGETDDELFERIYRRAGCLGQMMIDTEASDPEREFWPWTEYQWADEAPKRKK